MGAGDALGGEEAGLGELLVEILGDGPGVPDFRASSMRAGTRKEGERSSSSARWPGSSRETWTSSKGIPESLQMSQPRKDHEE